LSAAIACGVAITFGAPIGGMLFAIEVTSTQFTVNCLWKSFFASTISVLCFKAFGFTSKAALFSADASYFYSGHSAVGINHEQPFFIILGVLCGCLGTFYIYFQRVVNTTLK
jgi:H+/Cl- antiporter ClcA